MSLKFVTTMNIFSFRKMGIILSCLSAAVEFTNSKFHISRLSSDMANLVKDVAFKKCSIENGEMCRLNLEYWKLNFELFPSKSNDPIIFDCSSCLPTDDQFFTGQGAVKFPNGDIFIGEWLDGEHSGYGNYHYVDNSTYHGHYVNHQRHGFGVYSWNDLGMVYSGEWNNGEVTGYGVMTYDFGDESHTGNWSDGIATGLGTVSYANGNNFTGQFVSGEMNGYGAYSINNEARKIIHIGDWTNDFVRNGHGITIWGVNASFMRWPFTELNNETDYRQLGSQVYVGNFVDETISGFGVLTDQNINYTYIGNWHNNSGNGYGVATFSSGRQSSGNWVNSNMHGMGVMKFANGNKYSGRFAFGLRNGVGTFTFSNGTIIEGSWLNDAYVRNTTDTASFEQTSVLLSPGRHDVTSFTSYHKQTSVWFPGRFETCTMSFNSTTGGLPLRINDALTINLCDDFARNFDRAVQSGSWWSVFCVILNEFVTNVFWILVRLLLFVIIVWLVGV